MKKVIVSLVVGVVLFGLIFAARDNFFPKEANQDIVADKYAVLAGPQLLPVDEAAGQADFAQFRNELLEAIKEKNVTFIKEHVDDTIRYSFGINEGMAGFLESWNLTSSADKSDFWLELSKVINLGGTFDVSGAFVAPYVYSKFPESLDAFQNSAVVEEGVKLYSEPNRDSEVVGLLNYNIVLISAWEQGSLWQKVQVSEGIAGYVQSEYLRSPIDYRAMFASKAGTWKMVFFVAGD